MYDDVLDRYATKRKAQESPEESDDSGADDFGAFGWLRGAQDRALMLEIRHKDGNVTANAFAWLQSAKFDPSDGITLNFSGETVKISGQNLDAEVRPNVRLFAGIIRHRVPWIQEAAQADALQAANDAVVIEHVKMK